MGSRAQILTFEINTSPNTRETIERPLGDIWRTPAQLAVMYRMVKSHHAQRTLEPHPLAVYQHDHGSPYIHGTLHAFAIAGGMLYQTFQHTLDDDAQRAIMHILHHEPYAGEGVDTLAHLVSQHMPETTTTSPSDVARAASVLHDYWQWRNDNGPRGMWKTYAMAAVFTQNVFRRNQCQVPSQLQETVVQAALFQDRCEGYNGIPLSYEMRILAMEMQCNLFVRHQSTQAVSSRFCESSDNRTSIAAYGLDVSMPFAQVSRSRLRCPKHYGRGEPILCFLHNFVQWFNSEYTHDVDYPSSYMSNRQNAADTQYHKAFKRADLYNEWLTWAMRMLERDACTAPIAELLRDERYMQTFRHTITQLLINWIAPGLSEEAIVSRARHGETIQRKPYNYIRFKRVHPLPSDAPLNNAHVQSDAQHHTIETPVHVGEQLVAQQGYPLLDIASHAIQQHVKRLKPNPSK